MITKAETTEHSSITYKLRAPGVSEHAIYFTIVGDKPDALFINSKSMESFQWITALMTSYSRQIDSGTNINSIINDMKETFNPDGSYIIPDGSGRKVHSLVHHLGLILDGHVNGKDANVRPIKNG